MLINLQKEQGLTGPAFGFRSRELARNFRNGSLRYTRIVEDARGAFWVVSPEDHGVLLGRGFRDAAVARETSPVRETPCVGK
jgi:hypothetical protein